MSGFVLQSIEVTADPGFVLESIEASSAAMTLVTAIDAGNVSQSLTTIDDPFAAEPVVTLMNRSVTSGGWRHLLFALDDAEGKRPLFKAPRSTRYTNVNPTVDYLPVWTQDFQTWHRAPSRQLVGGSSGTIEWQFSDPFPPGRVYVATQPLGRQIDATYLAQELLTDYPAICAPVSSADAQGVFFTSPSETDENGRAIGAHPLYGLKLRFGGATTDGGPKRRLVMIAGIHAAGEATSWLPFVHCTRWMLNSISVEAAAFRSNWDVDLYFNITPNGVYGGSNRRNFRSTSDPNRIWNAPNAEIGATQSAILSEIGAGRFDAFYSWHSWSNSSSPFLCYVTPNQGSEVSRSPVMQAMIDSAGGFFGVSASITSSGTYDTDVWWAEQQGCPVSFDTEVQQNGSTDPEIYQTIGETWAKTLQAVDAAGWFGEAPAGTLTLGTPSVTSYSISLPWTYSASDHTGVEYRYRLTAGTWSAWADGGRVSPIEITGLTSSAEYEVEARSYNVLGTGTPQTVTVTVGVSVAIAPATGHISAQGYAPAIQQPRTVAPQTGQISARGYAPEIGQAASIRPETGHIQATGYAPTVQQGDAQAIAPQTGHAKLSGHAPIIVQGLPIVIAPQTGHIVAHGYAPSIGQPRTIAPQTGRAQLSGYAPGVVQGGAVTVNPQTGHVRWRGWAPMVTPDAELPLPRVALGARVQATSLSARVQ